MQVFYHKHHRIQFCSNISLEQRKFVYNNSSEKLIHTHQQQQQQQYRNAINHKHLTAVNFTTAADDRHACWFKENNKSDSKPSYAHHILFCAFLSSSTSSIPSATLPPLLLLMSGRFLCILSAGWVQLHLLCGAGCCFLA